MIDLTPLEVRQKKGDFRRALRGYDPELVNDFLDLAADRMEELVKENIVLKEKAEVLGTEVAAYREKEQALSHALMTAQKLREDARAHAEKEGELVLREAVLAAQAAREEAARQIVREEEALRQVRARRGQMVESFRRLLERELSQLAVIEESLELGRTRSSAARDRAGGATPTRARSREEGASTAASPGRGDATPPEEAAEPDTTDNAPDAAAPESEPPAESAEKRSQEQDGEQEDWLSSLIEEP